jgi:hypothetical protein
MKQLTDDEITKACNEPFTCCRPAISQIRSEVANTPEYLRRYFEACGKKEERKRILDRP